MVDDIIKFHYIFDFSSMIKGIIRRYFTNDGFINLLISITVLSFYEINNLWLKFYSINVFKPFFLYYFNDLLAPIFFGSISNFGLLPLQRQITKFKSVLVFYGVLPGLFWEIEPMIENSGTFDFIDLIMYLVGVTILWAFYKYLNHRNHKNSFN